MGWADCGNDSKGRPIGYVFEATCDHPSCDSEIDRGLSYACGDMHGDVDASCEKYFCDEHLNVGVRYINGDLVRVCSGCGEQLKENDAYIWDDEEGLFIEAES